MLKFTQSLLRSWSEAQKSKNRKLEEGKDNRATAGSTGDRGRGRGNLKASVPGRRPTETQMRDWDESRL